MNFWSHKPIAAHQAAETFFQAARHLVEAIQVTAAPAEERELERFQEELAALGKRMSLEDPGGTLAAAGGVAQALEQYNLGVCRGLRQHQSELRSIVAMLTETVSRCSTASGQSIHQLKHIEQRLEKAQAIEDLRLLKVQLGDCLASLKQESERQMKTWAEQIQNLTQGLETARRAVEAAGGGGEPEAPDADPLTGLPGKRSALAAVAEALGRPAGHYAILFAVEKVQAVNARLGYGAGDNMLLVWKQLLTKWFSEGARLFRWTGPAFLLLLKRDAPAGQVRAEVANAASTRHEQLFKVGNRSVLMLVTAAHVLVPLTEVQDAERLAKRLDEFVRARGEA
jgi:GGDEF domain-containing protein